MPCTFYHSKCSVYLTLLAHMSQRLIGELIGYSWSGIRPSSVVNNFKHLLLQNRLPDQSQILCGASLGRGTESLFAVSGSHDQDIQKFKPDFLRNYFANLNKFFHESLQVHDAGPMIKMAAMPTYGKNPLKIFSGTGTLISTKLGM